MQQRQSLTSPHLLWKKLQQSHINTFLWHFEGGGQRAWAGMVLTSITSLFNSFRITQIQGTTLPKPALIISLSSYGHISKGQTAEDLESSVRIRELGNSTQNAEPNKAKSINFVN